VDTAAMLMAARALDVIAADVAAAARAAAGLAFKHRSTIMIGRTLLQQAVPVTFGLVAAGWLAALDDAAAGLARVRADRLAVQFGGAAGTLASLDDAGPRVAALLAEELGLPLPVLPWHTNRLRMVELAGALVRPPAGTTRGRRGAARGRGRGSQGRRSTHCLEQGGHGRLQGLPLTSFRDQPALTGVGELVATPDGIQGRDAGWVVRIEAAPIELGDFHL